MKKLNFQKIFCFISFLFILSCCLFYGTRFIKLYLDNKQEEIEEKDSLAKTINEANKENENYKNINGNYYFTNNENNNYLTYSNLTWRIIKINSDNSITAIADHAITNLAYGEKLNYQESNINKWLNNKDENYTIDKYLQKTETCNSKYDKLTNNPCEDITFDNYITLLSIPDYLNIGSKNSYLNNNEYFYLANSDNEKNNWYISNNGNAATCNGEKIIGIKPVITIKANIDYISGNGSKENPYIIENENNLFGAFVKLDNDIWRIYEVNDNDIKLVLNEQIKDFTYQYSIRNSFFDDQLNNTIAYYLNHTFLNSLSYKDKIKETNWSNGEYNENNNFNYIETLKKTINSKVALISIGNPFLTQNANNYYTMTQIKHKGNEIYTIQSNQQIYPKNISLELNIVPTISIDKNVLTKGQGTINEPFEME